MAPWPCHLRAPGTRSRLVLVRGASPLGLPNSRPRSPLRRLASGREARSRCSLPNSRPRSPLRRLASGREARSRCSLPNSRPRSPLRRLASGREARSRCSLPTRALARRFAGSHPGARLARGARSPPWRVRDDFSGICTDALDRRSGLANGADHRDGTRHEASPRARSTYRVISAHSEARRWPPPAPRSRAARGSSRPSTAARRVRGRRSDRVDL